MSQPINVLVLGATGNVAKAATESLLKLTVSRPVRVIAAVRNVGKAADLQRQGAELRAFNFDDSASLSAVFKGVDHAFIVPPNPAPDSKPFDRANIAIKAIDAAKTAGVKYIVMLSVLGAQYESITFAKEFRHAEKHLEASGVKWATLRAPMFMENAIGAASYIKQGVYAQPLGEDHATARYAPVSVYDLGRIAAKLLVEPGTNVNVHIEMSGPESLSGPEQAEAIGRAVGHPVKYQNLPNDALIATAKSWGFPDWQAQGMVELYDVHRSGATVKPNTDFVRVMGVPMTTFEERMRQLHQYGLI